MKIPENLCGQPYREISIDKALPFLQAFTSSPYICQEIDFSPRVYQDPHEKNRQELQVYLWAPDWDGQNGEWVEALVAYSFNPRAGKHNFGENLVLSLYLPFPYLDERVFDFADELTEGWIATIDELRSQGHLDLNWQMHDLAEGADTGAMYIVDEEEEEGTLTIQTEDTWDEKGYEADPRDGLPREEYALQIAERMAHLVRSLRWYVPQFIETEIPRLVHLREKRLRTKPPLWTLEVVERLGVTGLRSAWQEPETGTEPHEFNLGGVLTIDEKNYIIGVTAIEHGDPDWPARFKVIILFPPDISAALEDGQMSEQTQQAFSEYLIGSKHFKSLIHDLRKIADFSSICLAIEPKTIAGLSFEVDEPQLRQLLNQGYIRESILKKIIQGVVDLHPLFLNFASKTPN